MKINRRTGIVASLLTLALAMGAGVRPGCAQIDEGGAPGTNAGAPLELTPAQRNAIYTAVSKDKSKVSRSGFPRSSAAMCRR